MKFLVIRMNGVIPLYRSEPPWYLERNRLELSSNSLAPRKFAIKKLILQPHCQGKKKLKSFVSNDQNIFDFFKLNYFLNDFNLLYEKPFLIHLSHRLQNFIVRINLYNDDEN